MNSIAECLLLHEGWGQGLTTDPLAFASAYHHGWELLPRSDLGFLWKCVMPSEELIGDLTPLQVTLVQSPYFFRAWIEEEYRWQSQLMKLSGAEIIIHTRPALRCHVQPVPSPTARTVLWGLGLSHFLCTHPYAMGHEQEDRKILGILETWSISPLITIIHPWLRTLSPTPHLR